jgi:hypothetical protein
LTWEDRACLGPVPASSKGTFHVKTTGRRTKIKGDEEHGSVQVIMV